jgi:adhesin/invasin
VNGADVFGTATIAVTQTVVRAAVHSVTVTSPRSALVQSDTMHLTVVLRDAQNNILTGRAITFTSNAPNRMAVDAAGVVTSLTTSGNHGIVATSEGKSGSVNIRGIEGVDRLSIRGPTNGPLDLLIQRSATKRYTITAEDSRGRGVGGVTISVTSSDANIISPSAASVVTAGSGRATVDITAGSTIGAAIITFTAVRAGAIPPGTPGNNTSRAALPIIVP